MSDETYSKVCKINLLFGRSVRDPTDSDEYFEYLNKRLQYIKESITNIQDSIFNEDHGSMVKAMADLEFATQSFIFLSGVNYTGVMTELLNALDTRVCYTLDDALETQNYYSSINVKTKIKEHNGYYLVVPSKNQVGDDLRSYINNDVLKNIKCETIDKSRFEKYINDHVINRSDGSSDESE